MARHKHQAAQPIQAKPVRPISMNAEMAKDYRIFRAAGLLHEWRIKWAAYLPTPD
jgi:hypothetical protein